MKIEWSRKAILDLDRFANFLHQRFPAMAEVVAGELSAKTKILQDNPRLGRLIRKQAEYREIILRVLNAPYVVRYGIEGQTIVILRVFHGRESREM
jgi:plasmid stabilization system protein ParE